MSFHPEMRVFPSYQVIATLGPGSREPACWRAMIAAGATGFRLNTSHLTLGELDNWLERIRRFYLDAGASLPVVLDLQGSKWRLGACEARELLEGEVLELVLGETAPQSHGLPIPHPDFFKAASHSSQEVALNDARVILHVVSAGPDWVRARVIRGGPVAAHKGVTYTSSEFRIETISPKDRSILERVKSWPVLRAAVSYVKDGQEMEKYRELSGSGVHLAAKLERGPALADAARIAAACDELWLCRGDLGAELGLRSMAEAVARFSQMVGDYPVPVLMAGQVLEHMVTQAHPTRSEVCYLHDTLAAGYRGFVLSDETAIGKYPVDACLTANLFQR